MKECVGSPTSNVVKVQLVILYSMYPLCRTVALPQSSCQHVPKLQSSQSQGKRARADDGGGQRGHEGSKEAWRRARAWQRRAICGWSNTTFAVAAAFALLTSENCQRARKSEKEGDERRANRPPRESPQHPTPPSPPSLHPVLDSPGHAHTT